MMNIKDRLDHLKQLRPAKEILEENMGWLQREGCGTNVKVRLLSLDSVLSRTYGKLEEYGPIDEAINYAASGSDCIFDFVDTIAESGRADQAPESLIQELTRDMMELQADLESIPGFVAEGYLPGSPWSYYFLGVTNQGKGLVACVNEEATHAALTDSKEIPF